MWRVRTVVALVLVVLVAVPTGAADAGHAANKVVVHGKFKSVSKDKRTITYTARNGTYTAKWIGARHYRLRGKINGRRLTGTFRTHQARHGDRYVASGSGRLGGRHVKIRGGGPNSLKTSTLVLS
jgi:hypothetical protein